MKRRNILKAFVGLIFLRTKEKEIISALSSKPTQIIGENALKSVEGGFHRNIGIGYKAGYHYHID